MDSAHTPPEPLDPTPQPLDTLPEQLDPPLLPELSYDVDASDTDFETSEPSLAMLPATQQALSRDDPGQAADGSRVTEACDSGHSGPSPTVGRSGAPFEMLDVVGGTRANAGSRSVRPSSYALPDAAASSSKPLDGVYTLHETIQEQIATLLRTLFVVQTSSDKSIMAFLGVAHYLMAFSSLVGISSISARSDFYEALLIAFEKPGTMKHFMEAAFRCGRRGLHVGGRTSCLRHVAGQPKGLRADILRENINPRNVKVQWVSRRLSLRVGVDVQRGARSTAGGLSAADRLMLAGSLTKEDVCAKLRERGCTVKFANDVGDSAVRKPIAVAFRWDAGTSWFFDSLEETLVKTLRGTLLRSTPAVFVDRDVAKEATLTTRSRPGLFKRSDADSFVTAGQPSSKRARGGPEQPSDAGMDEPCSACGRRAENKTAAPPLPLVASRVEQWSADVEVGPHLPRGGHLLAFSLPMHMDTGPGGRPHVAAEVFKTSDAGSLPHRYSLYVKTSTRPAKQMGSVEGATFAVSDASNKTLPPSAQSFDILRSVQAHIERRAAPTSPATSVRDAHAVGSASGKSVSLSVRYATSPAPFDERIDFTSKYELCTTAELVERCPGRMTVFWQGIDPLPVTGVFTL